MDLIRKFIANIKLKLLLENLASIRKGLLNNNMSIIKNSVLMIQNIGIPETDKDIKDLKFAIEHYEKAVKELENDVDRARLYTKED